MFHVFPHGLEATLLVPVLLGVLVNASFTELFGWEFVGLVVPGYLCAVTMLQPLVAAVVVVEAVLTWAAARALDAASTRVGLTDPVFGRDRFYLILAVSVIVRAAVEGLGLPAALSALRPHVPTLGRFEPDLFGIGLVLVPLTANRLWKSGLPSGLIQLGVEVAIVRVLLLGLQALTNFSVAGFALSFDRMALGFLAAPGAQIVILCTAALASHFNRRFGWDAHGILVPALLGLVVMAPLKMAATIVETGLIVAALAAFVRLPRFRQMNLEGPRKVVLCFAAGFLIRAVLVGALGVAYPGYRASDLFGFGYLLPSLLAERVIARGRATMVVLTTVQTALIGIPLAGGVALALDRVAPQQQALRAPVAAERYATLAQAVAAHAHTGMAVAGHAETLAHAAERLQLGTPIDAMTGDGYLLVRVDGAGQAQAVLARPADQKTAAAAVWLVPPGDEHGERAAAHAASEHAALIVAADSGDRAVAAARLGVTAHAFTDLAPPEEIAPVDESLPLRTLVLPPPPSPHAPAPPPPVPPPARAVREAAFRIEGQRAQPARLAGALHVLGLGVHRSPDGPLVIEGAGWPAIVLRAPAPAPLVVAPHAREVRSDAAALAASEILQGDAILARDDGAAPDEKTATELGMALAALRARPLLMIRGTEFSVPGNLLVLSHPATDSDAPSPWPAWAAALDRATAGWLQPARLPPADAGALRRFPTGAAFLDDAALAWLSPRARQALAGDSDVARPDFVGLAAARGLPVLNVDLGDWLLAGGGGAPTADALANGERLVSSGDPLRLQRRLGSSDALILIDARRGLTAVGPRAHDRRAVIVGGDRRDERAVVASPAAVAGALARGVRTLLAQERS